MFLVKGEKATILGQVDNFVMFGIIITYYVLLHGTLFVEKLRSDDYGLFFAPVANLHNFSK